MKNKMKPSTLCFIIAGICALGSAIGGFLGDHLLASEKTDEMLLDMKKQIMDNDEDEDED